MDCVKTFRFMFTVYFVHDPVPLLLTIQNLGKFKLKVLVISDLENYESGNICT